MLPFTARPWESCFKSIKLNFLISSEILFYFIYLFPERGEGREKEREKGKGEREGEKHQCVVASCAPLMGTWPTTQACALTGNRTVNPFVCRPALHPLSHTSQSSSEIFIGIKSTSINNSYDLRK